MIDTHIHIYDKQFDADREELLDSFTAEGVEAIVAVAAEKESLEKVVALTKERPWIYGALGLHPDEVGDLTEETRGFIRAHLADPKIVAVGEIGLDYYWNKEAKEVQIAAFREQIGMAKDAGLPIMVHSREAAEDTMDVIREEAAGIRGAIAAKRGQDPENVCPGIIHCYSYSVEHARLYTEMGFCLGIGGVVTYKNGKKLKEVVQEIPLSHLVLETDAPYLTPEPFRRTRNDSRRILYVMQTIAELKGISVEEVDRVTSENARQMLRIPV